jgi:hypothetical protein
MSLLYLHTLINSNYGTNYNLALYTALIKMQQFYKSISLFHQSSYANFDGNFLVGRN